MAIEFACSGCGKKMRAPDDSAGKRAKCPLCGASQTIPAEAADDDVFPSVGPAQVPAGQPPAPPQQPQPPQSVDAPMAAGDVVPPPPGSSMPVDCLKAISYGVSNFRSIFILAMWAVVLAIILGLVRLASIFFGRFIMGAIAATTNVILGGFYLRFWLDAVISSLEGADQAPDVPVFSPREMLRNGLKGLGILCVYVLPIVTIPLLPLGLLALGYSNDVRAYDLTWAFRAASRKPAQLLILWPILLLWIAVTVAVSVLLWIPLGMLAKAVASTGCLGILMSLVILAAGVAVIATVNVMFITVLFRCVGMLGRYNPMLLEILPDEPAPLKSAAFIAAGVIVSVLMIHFIISPALIHLAEIASG